MKHTIILVALILGACTPAIIGLSLAAGGATVAATYEVKGEKSCSDDAGAK